MTSLRHRALHQITGRLKGVGVGGAVTGSDEGGVADSQDWRHSARLPHLIFQKVSFITTKRYNLPTVTITLNYLISLTYDCAQHHPPLVQINSAFEI